MKITLSNIGKAAAGVAGAAALGFVIIVSGPPRPMPPAPADVPDANFFVGPGGSDLNACTTALLPCASVDGAEGKATADSGHIIEVAAGTYVGASNRIQLTKSGITYRGYGDGGCPTTAQTDAMALLVGITTKPNPDAITTRWLIQASNITIDCVRVRPGANSDAIDIDGTNRDNIRIVNNVLEGRETGPNGAIGCKIGFVADDGTDVATMAAGWYIANNYITGCSIGTGLQGTDATFEFNEFEELYAISGDMDCMRSWGERNTFQRNYCHGNLQANCEDSTGMPPDPFNCHLDCFQAFTTGVGPPHQVLKDFTFTRNVCLNAGSAGIQIHLAPTTSIGPFDGIDITNNIFARGEVDESPDAMGYCMNIQGSLDVKVYHNTCAFRSLLRGTEGGDVDFKNNIIADGSGIGIGYSLGTTGDEEYNLLWDSNETLVNCSGATPCDATDILNQNPLFTNAATNVFTLEALSPAKNAGTNTVGVSVDITGAAR